MIFINAALFLNFAFWAARDVRVAITKRPIPQSPGSARRWKRLEAAYNQPTYAEYRRAITPLRNRGFLRLGLLAGMLIAIAILSSQLGIGAACIVSVAGFAVITLLIERLWPLPGEPL